MLNVNTKGPADPVWVELAAGARIQLKPATALAFAAGRALAQVAVLAGADGAEAGAAFTIGFAAWGAIAWEGVGDEAGEPLELTRDNVKALLEQSQAAYDAVDQHYVIPALEAEAEKNGSSPLLAGTSPAGAKTKKTTARSPGAAGTTAAPAPKSAPSAHTS